MTGTTVEPNVAKSWEIAPDGKSITLYLRKRMKWSDGHPFTADDVLFWYEDYLLNKELNPSFPVWMAPGGVPGTVEKVDDYTVRINFAYANGLILESLASVPVFLPKHYLKQFHPTYTPMEKLEAIAKKEGLEYWYQVFQNKDDWIVNPERPTHKAWKPMNLPTAQNWIMERNPYYWKVDPEGNQLPYVDRIVHELAANAEMVTMKAVAGELDMQLRHINVSDFTLLRENAEKGNYRVIQWIPALGSDLAIFINQNVKDLALQEIFIRPEFRQALSLAVNREEINDLIYLGLGEPRQATMIPESPYYRPEFEKAYAEYDPERANQMLDAVGLVERGKDGFRLRSDGKTLMVTIDVAPVFGPWVDVCEMIKMYWEAVGVKTAINTIERGLFFARAHAGDHEMNAWNMDRASQPWYYPCWWVPATGDSWFAPLTTTWYLTDGKGGEAPPTEELQQLIDLYEQLKMTVDPDEKLRVGQEILQLHAENVWSIGTVGLVPSAMCIGVVKNYFGNVPDESHGAVSDCMFDSPGNGHPEQFFIRQK
ncbi:MAG: ABC transporter substrate-binding protein [Firmicutes bacterium]|nr:ABC transporter substrate-binding protein [Bacillota bacterium]